MQQVWEHRRGDRALAIVWVGRRECVTRGAQTREPILFAFANLLIYKGWPTLGKDASLAFLYRKGNGSTDINRLHRTTNTLPEHTREEARRPTHRAM